MAEVAVRLGALEGLSRVDFWARLARSGLGLLVVCFLRTLFMTLILTSMGPFKPP